MCDDWLSVEEIIYTKTPLKACIDVLHSCICTVYVMFPGHGGCDVTTQHGTDEDGGYERADPLPADGAGIDE